VSFAARVSGYRDRIETVLERGLPGPLIQPARLHTAMRYSVLGGGKRIRPLLVYATGELLGLAAETLDPIAMAIELVHAYSLVHDDLPAMDNDDLRRGRPTTHIAFDETTAILAGDALQAHVYELLATTAAIPEPEMRRHLIADLARATGSTGMAAGQAMDLAAEGRIVEAAELEDLYSRKTGELIRAAVVMPCRCSPGLAPDNFAAMDRFGRAIGLAFQIADDLLDVEGETEIIGKTRGSDIRNRKATYPALFGLAATHRRLDELYAQAMSALAPFGERAEPLRYLCDYSVQRDR
jgi:farnesyl diphosphate synthase